MPFTAIKGTFHVVGYSPDGDSVRFKADNNSNWDALSGREVKLNSKDHAQLRIEAIDTLETHYKKEHQPKQFANAATEQLFSLLGIENVKWNASGSRVKSADDGIDGYIISRTTERYGRPVAFVFKYTAGLTDGEEVYLNNSIARKSVNYKLLVKGLAYPTFYDGLFYDLRALFAKAAEKARSVKKGLWASDTTNKYFSVTDISDVTEKNVILPKLFQTYRAA